MGKVSDQINQFTETYSTIVVGMHNDIKKYRKEVQSLSQSNKSFEDNLYRIYNSTKQLQEANYKISEKIEDKKAEIERLYREISASLRQINSIDKRLDEFSKSIEKINSQSIGIQSDFRSLKINLTEEQGKRTQLNSDLQASKLNIQNLNERIEELRILNSQQSEQMHTQKLLIIGCFSLIGLILILTLVL